MKIAIISPYISTTADLKYYQSQQINLAKELTKLGIQVDIITLKRNKDELKKERLEQGINIYRLPLLSKWIERTFRQPVIKGLWRQLKKENYDFIQCSEDFALTTLFAALHILFNKSRLIIYQGVYTYSDKRIIRLLMFLYDLIAGPVLRYVCWMAVCKTNKASQYLQGKGYKKVRVIPIGVNTSIFYPEKIEGSETYELLTVGNFIPLKNYNLLMEVFRLLNNLNDKVRLTIIGTGPEESKIINYLKQYSLMDKVKLLKNVPNSQIREYYSEADLFMLFSKIEIFGMVILEAMACGCPVVSTPAPGALDVISNNVNGFIVKDKNPDEIARLINSILCNRNQLMNIRENAINTVNEKYSWPIIAKQYHDLYLEQSDG